MKKLNMFIVKLMNPIRGEKGQGMVEYGLIIALVSIVVIGALVVIGTRLNGTFNNIASSLPATSTPAA